VSEPDAIHYELVTEMILEGGVIPFLGAGVNMCGRTDDLPWAPGGELPSGRQLAEYLAEKRQFPPAEPKELVRVSQYVNAVLGRGVLYKDLRAIFTAEYEPNDVHTFLARLPAALRERDQPQQLIVTTNYDDALERAFERAGEAYDVLYYEANPKGQLGKFFHRRSGSTTAALVEAPNECTEIKLKERPVVLKIHGAIDRNDPGGDSFVITEDDYIDYLSKNELKHFVSIKRTMLNSHYLFLGYSLQDWNLRVILNEIWHDRDLDVKSWAIQKPDPTRDSRSIDIERQLWKVRGDVDLLTEDLAAYIAKLDAHIPQQATAPAAV
jgi:SIR2-like domain